jgi:hypothetical protein
LSSKDNDIAKEVNGMESIKGHNKYAKFILPVILYKCEIWSHIYARTAHRLTVFENKVLRKILGIKQTQQMVGQNSSQEPYDLYSLQILRAINPQTILCA